MTDHALENSAHPIEPTRARQAASPGSDASELLSPREKTWLPLAVPAAALLMGLCAVLIMSIL